MKISTFNTQNNNYQNRPAKPAFGMEFSLAAKNGIKKSQRFITTEMATVLDKLTKHQDTCTLSQFLIHEESCLINVDDRHGINVFSFSPDERDSGKILEKLKYLLSGKFYKGVARLDKKHEAEAKALQLSQNTGRLELLAKVSTTGNDLLMHDALPAFIQKGLPEDQAKALINRLITEGTTDPKTLKEIAEGI